MSLEYEPIAPVPTQTRRVALAAFPKGNPYLTLRDELGPIFSDLDFVSLFSKTGKSAVPPWQLALVTLMQFRENLSDRTSAALKIHDCLKQRLSVMRMVKRLEKISII
jgi:transposase